MSEPFFVDVAKTDADYPEVSCPKCGQWETDMDGFGFLSCNVCGHCTHPCRTDGECDLCGDLTGGEGNMNAPTRVELSGASVTVDRLIQAVWDALCGDDRIPAGELCERHAEQLGQAADAVRFKLQASDHPCPACMGEGDGVDASGCSRCGSTGQVRD
jgi:hypothetical protein